MAEASDFDMSLFDGVEREVSAPVDVVDSDTDIDSVVDLSDGEELETQKPAGEDSPSTSSTEPTGSPVPDKTEDSPGQTPFDYDQPLNPREQLLLERLQAVTTERLEAGRPAPVEPESPQFNLPKEEVDYIEDQDLDQVFANAKNFNTFLNVFANRIMESAANLTAEGVMRSLPSTVSTFVTQHIETRQMIDDFYDENKDLVNVKPTVAMVANEISSQEPDLTLNQVFQKAAIRTREVLRMKALSPPTKQQPKGQQTRRPGALPGQQGGNASRGRLNVPELDGLAKEVNELLVEG